MKHGCTTILNEPIVAMAIPPRPSPVDPVQVAALFIDPSGPYPGLVGAEYCWDIDRDARTYPGRCPVVAHPPCQLWVNFAALNFKRYGGEHNRPGNDGGAFASALASVRRWGGVLEHPASSNAWAAHGLTRPPKGRTGWVYNGLSDREYVCEVWQSAYGHKARKRTWLFYASPSPCRPPFQLCWERPLGTHQVGWFDRIKPTLSKREASRSPDAFARELVRLAQVSGINEGVSVSC